MCTVTWQIDAEGLHAFCNRDELRTRPPARPPEIHREGPLAWMGPSDPVADGTWLGVNAAGLFVTLLNYYDADTQPDPATHHRSRGLLVVDALAHRTPDAVEKLLQELSQYRPFHLLALHPEAAPRAWSWNGRHRIDHADPASRQPWSSSSFRTDDVLSWRTEQYRALGADRTPDAAETFHATRHPDIGAFGVCMDRPDARTHSFSRVDIGPESIHLTYRDGFPDDPEAPVHETTLVRERTAGG